MRYIFAGAEKVREETKRLFAERFGVRILEGYGATETAPVIALNTAMHCRRQHGRTAAARDRTSARTGRRASRAADGCSCADPTSCSAICWRPSRGFCGRCADGWYDTGDIVSIDAAGFVSITGTRQTLRQNRRRDGVAGRRRGAGLLALARRSARRRACPRPEERRAPDPGDHSDRCRHERAAGACAATRRAGDHGAAGAAAGDRRCRCWRPERWIIRRWNDWRGRRTSVSPRDA